MLFFYFKFTTKSIKKIDTSLLQEEKSERILSFCFTLLKKNLTVLSVQVLQIDMFMAYSPCF